MKRYLFLLLILPYSLGLWAGENDWHIGLSPSLLFNPHTRTIRQAGVLSLEKQLSGRKAMEFSLLASANRGTEDFIKESELLLLAHYKPVLTLGKNTYSHFKLGGNLGFASQGLLFGISAGFEYNIVFRNRIKLFFSQDNILVFRGDDRFSSGISIGLKLPL